MRTTRTAYLIAVYVSEFYSYSTMIKMYAQCLLTIVCLISLLTVVSLYMNAAVLSIQQLYSLCRALPIILVMSIFVIILICSNYMLVTETSTCSCWCLPTLGNVLPLAISVDIVSLFVSNIALSHSKQQYSQLFCYHHCSQQYITFIMFLSWKLPTEL